MADVFAHKKSLNNLSRAKRSVPGITPSILQSIEMGTDSVSHKKQYSIMDNKKFLNLIAAPSPLTNSLSHSKITHNRDSSGDSKLTRPQSRLRLGGPGEKSAVLLDSKLSRPQSQLKIRTPTPVDREKIVSLKGVNTSHMARRPEDIPKMMMHQKKLSEGRNSVSKSRIEVSTPQEEPPKPRLTLKKSIVGAVQTLTKKHVIAQKIVKEYEEEDKSSAQVSEAKNKIQFQEDFFQPHKKKRTSEFIAKVELNLSLTIVLEALENAIAEARDRTALYKHMERAAEAAFCSKNGELYMAVLKTQAKILLAYNDIYKGISVFKILKKVGETKKDYMTKLISYKYIGRCFQMMGNHAMAIFYYTKLLQMAWYCNKNPYELRAYDLIGIQYFYLGDLERAKFYHNKMTDGRAESKDSDLRKLGISKLLNKMTEFAQPKKESLVTPIEFELGGRYPLSEDDFELPPPDNQSRNKENREIMNEIFGVREKSPPKKDLGEFRRIVVRRKLDHDRGKPKKGMIRARVGVQEQSTEYILQEEDKEVLDETGKKHLFLSHLSPNRLVKNFNSKDTKDVIRDYMTNGNGKDGNMIGLDGKALEGVKNKIMKLKNAIVLALQRVVEIESRSKGL